MSYTPNTWQTGDIVTAQKLNNMETGITNASLPSVDGTDNGKVLTVVSGSWAAANPSGGIVNLVYDDDTSEINASYNDLSGYLQDGKIVQFLISGQDSGATYTRRYVLSEIYIYDGYYYGVFSTIVSDQFGSTAFVSETATDNLVSD